MEITRGKINKAKKVVVYGPEGIGKSTFASKFRDPVFIDTEDSTKEMDVARLPAPTSWQMILEEVMYVRDHPDTCGTLVIDTADKAQAFAIAEMCAEHQCKSVEDPGYGKGYVYAYEKFGKLINLLDEVVERGIDVVITAHAAMRKFEQPDELGSYDRWEMKLVSSKNYSVSAMLREWADMVLFVNYKTHIVSEDKEGKKKKALGSGQRVMYTTHHSCWDAKNRYGLPDELPFDYAEIAHIFKESSKKTINAPEKQTIKREDPPAETDKKETESTADPKQMTLDFQKTEAPPDEEVSEKSKRESEKASPGAKPVSGAASKPAGLSDKIPKALRDLMTANDVFEHQIQKVVAKRGYYPIDVKIWEYDKDFIDGCLVAAWDQVYKMIEDDMNEGFVAPTADQEEEIPFD